LLAEDGFVRLEVFNTLGQRVALLVDESQRSGVHEVHFGGREVPSGVYFYRFSARDHVQMRKLLLLK
jgi:hypothetical protein